MANKSYQTSQNANKLPPVRQEFIINPRLVIDDDFDNAQTVSTDDDFQPRTEDITKRARRHRRGRNLVSGVIMMVLSLVLVLPYVGGALGTQATTIPFNLIPDGQFNAIYNIVSAFKMTAELGWKGVEVNAIWLNAIPSLIIILGILFVVFNLIKSVIGTFFKVKPTEYFVNALINFVCVATILIASLIGAPKMGIAKIDFLQDFLYAYKTSDLFVMVVFATGYMIVAGICTAICKDKQGYLRRDK